MSASQAILDTMSPLCFNRGVGEKQSHQSSTGMGVSPEGRNAGFSPAMTTNDNGDDMNDINLIHQQAKARLGRLTAERAALTDKDGPWSATDERHAAAIDHSIQLTLETIEMTL